MDMVHQEGFRRWARRGGVAALALLLSTCGGDGSPTDPNGNGIGTDTGSIQVTASTTNNLDPDGYEVSVGGSVVDTIEVNGSVTIPDVPTGNRTVSLAGIAPNCALEGESAQALSVTKGSTASVPYSVTCTDPPEGRIFFKRGGGGPARISVMNSDGSGVTDLLPLPEGGVVGASRLTSAPEGKRIAFTAVGGGRLQLFVMNKDASEVTQLTSTSDSYEGHPSWSPDGSKLAFNVGPENFQIMTLNADGSSPTQLTDHADHWSQWPDWSPDGSKIAFSRHTKRHSLESDDRIHVMDADGTGVAALTEPAPICDAEWGFGWPKWYDFFPRWSPDGSKILFLRMFECDADPTNDYEALFVMNADGSNAVELVTGAAWADWSPDGSRIVYIKEDIYVMNADGTGSVRILQTGSGVSFLGVGWAG